MTEKPQELIVTPNLAAHFLASKLGLTAEAWLYRLGNWRRPGRRAPLPFVATESGHPGYTMAALEKFIAGQHATTIAIAGDTAVELVQASAVPHVDGTDKPHIRVIFITGKVTQSVFFVDAAAARRLADKLTKSAAILERVAPTEGATA